MIGKGLNFWKNLGSRVKQRLKQWTKPVTTPLVTGTLSDMTCSRADRCVSARAIPPFTGAVAVEEHSGATYPAALPLADGAAAGWTKSFLG